MKEGGHPRSISRETEIWKGMYNGETVALKVLRGRGDYVRKTKSVSTLCDPQSGGWLVIALTDKIAVLRGSGVDEAA